MSTHSTDRSASVKHVRKEATQLRPLPSGDTRSHREALVVNDVLVSRPEEGGRRARNISSAILAQ